jgi:thiamine-phosphate pyrophosphorylase
MAKPSLQNYRLYLVTDPVLHKGYPVLEQVRLALVGGVKLIQLREKELPTGKFVDLARKALDMTRKAGAFLIVNDRVDVALTAGADGVHIGQDDMSLSDTRRLLGQDKIIGISVRSAEEAQEAEKDGADYIAASGVFATDTKKDVGSALGRESLQIIHEAASLPLIAIGGIKIENCAEVIKAGADGVAVVSGITMSDDIPETCRAFIEKIEKAHTESYEL